MQGFSSSHPPCQGLPWRNIIPKSKPKPRTVELVKSGYQPTQAEIKEEFDLPEGLTLEQLTKGMTNTASQLSGSSDVQRVVREVYRLIDLESAELDDEFFPAHLSVALIDTVFNPQLNYKKRVVPIIERYCDRFGLCRMRRDKARLPPIHEQETLTDLIEHYKVLGQRVMREEVFNA